VNKASNTGLEVAEIILNGDKEILTAYGRKTKQGVAELFDNKARELMVRVIVRGVIDRLESREPGEYNVNDPDDYTHGVIEAGSAMLQDIAARLVEIADLNAKLFDQFRLVHCFNRVKREEANAITRIIARLIGG
jgi:hypothetical protein